MLFGIIPEQTNLLQAVQPIPTGAAVWRFFKHYSAYVKERSLTHIQKEYRRQLAVLERAFICIKNELVVQRSSMALILPNQEHLNLILNETLDFEASLVEIYSDVVNLESSIQALNIKYLTSLIDKFREKYIPFIECKVEYNTALEDATYLKQRR